MAGSVRIQWCPSCEAWKESELVSQEILRGSVAGGALGAYEFDYHLNSNRCRSCDEEFVTTKPRRFDRRYNWHVSLELMRPRSGAQSGVAADQIEPALIQPEETPKKSA